MFIYVTDDSKTESRIKNTFKITEWQYNDVDKSKHIRALSRMLFYFNTTGKKSYSTLNIHSV